MISVVKTLIRASSLPIFKYFYGKLIKNFMQIHLSLRMLLLNIDPESSFKIKVRIMN